MNELNAPVIRFRHAAAAAGVTKKTIRNWLVRGQISVDSPSEGWNTFTMLDLVRIATTAELVKYGVGVLPAFMAAQSQVENATWRLSQYQNTPAAIVLHAFNGWRMFVQHTETGLQFLHAKPGEEPAENWGPVSTLIIEMAPLVQLVVERLANALDQDDSRDADED